MARGVRVSLLGRGGLWLAGVVAVLLRLPWCPLGPYVWSMLRRLMIGRCVGVAALYGLRALHVAPLYSLPVLDARRILWRDLVRLVLCFSVCLSSSFSVC